MKTKFILPFFVALFLFSCAQNDVFFQYCAIPQAGWSQDSMYTFDIAITDTTANYNVYVNVRNRGEYPYQNIWLFLHSTTPDGAQMADTIECYLADQRGRWLGQGTGSILEMPVLYKQNFKFSKAGVYHYGIVQGMRDTVLAGINDIGMRVEIAGNK